MEKIIEEIIGLGLLLGITALLSFLASWMIKVLNPSNIDKNNDE